MKRRSLVVSFLFFVTCGLGVACHNSLQEGLPPPTEPQRVISLKPNLTEMLFALGLGDRVVGVTEHCAWPEEAKKRPKIGDYALPNLEKILTLRPDLIVTIKDASSPRPIEVLTAAKIPVVVFETTNLTTIFQTIERMGKIFRVEGNAQALMATMKQKLDALALKATGRSLLKTLVVVQRRPLIVAGPSTFISELVRTVGGRNVVPTGGLAYPHLSMEQVLAWQPEVIFDLDPASNTETWERYQSIPALQSRQLYFLSPDLFRPGPRITEAAQMIAQALQKNHEAHSHR